MGQRDSECGRLEPNMTCQQSSSSSILPALTYASLSQVPHSLRHPSLNTDTHTHADTHTHTQTHTHTHTHRHPPTGHATKLALTNKNTLPVHLLLRLLFHVVSP